MAHGVTSEHTGGCVAGDDARCAKKIGRRKSRSSPGSLKDPGERLYRLAARVATANVVNGLLVTLKDVLIVRGALSVSPVVQAASVLLLDARSELLLAIALLHRLLLPALLLLQVLLVLHVVLLVMKLVLTLGDRSADRVRLAGARRSIANGVALLRRRRQGVALGAIRLHLGIAGLNVDRGCACPGGTAAKGLVVVSAPALVQVVAVMHVMPLEAAGASSAAATGFGVISQRHDSNARHHGAQQQSTGHGVHSLRDL